ncbi:MAG TPA: VOC family protein [Ignavibacteriaceae bacterium]|nr:VOC family protein [Ignavibacteriaceae bacterium]
MAKMSPVVHFEMAAEDRKRMADFYTKVFGWKTEMLGPDMGNYVVVRTSETDEKGHPKTPGNIGGGFYQKMEDPDMNHPSVVIAVEDLNDSVSKVKKSGGKILGDPADIPGIGKYVSFKDTEGNRVGMLQPSQEM